MIEIVGTGTCEQPKLKWRNLPKNVRQIGECGEKKKIYIEDYVVTYLNKMARPDQAYARGAILLGELCETQEGVAVFISGAVEAGNLELDLDETVFNERIWYDLMEKAEQFFPGQEIMGWFLSRIGFSVEINQKIVNTHLKNFPDDYKVLYMIDSLEKEDAMYLCENRQMKKQKGYYIYYEKNSNMQNYMLEGEKSSGRTAEEEVKKSEIRRDKKIVNSYRRMNRYRKDNKKQDYRIKAIRAACGALIFVMGIYIAGRLGDRFVNPGFEEYAVAAFQTIKNIVMPEKNVPVEEEVQKAETYSYEEATVTEEASTEEKVESQVSETVSYLKPLYYTIQKGDTLASISRKMYSTARYAGQIAEVNNISNADEIFVGQKILIPSVE